MWAHLSKAAEHFWLGYTLFLIIFFALWYWGVRNWGSCKSREVLNSLYVWLFLIFVFGAIGGYISAAPWGHALAYVIIWLIVLAIIWCVATGKFRNRGCSSECGSSTVDSCGSNNNSWGGRFGRGGCFGREHGWRAWLYVAFWFTLGFVIGTYVLRELSIPKGFWNSKILYGWWGAAILVLALIGLIWQVGWRNARARARCVMLNRRVWILLHFFAFLFLGALSAAPWYVGLIIILVIEALFWGLSCTFCWFRKGSHHTWSNIIYSTLGFMVGVYIIRSVMLANGSYYACEPILPMMKHRLF